MPIMLEGLVPLIALIVVASSVTSIAKAFITARHRSAGGTPVAQLRRVEELMTELQTDVRMLRDEVTDLNERVDFAERLLARGREEGRPLGGGRAP